MMAAIVVHSNCAANGMQNQNAFRLVQFGLFGLDFAGAAGLQLYSCYTFVRAESDQLKNH